MKKNFFLTLMLALVALFSIETATAQAPVATPTEAITGLLNRIGGNGAADKFEIVIDASLAENGKDVFVITSQNGKPCIKGNTQLSVATGINWYLNHYAHINLTWNNLTTDLSQVTLPVPGSEEKHVCNTTYRYDFNTCTFSYSMAFWTWERWQQEIDWMALHGINAPLNLVGLDVVTRKFLRELGVSESDIDAYIAGPGFIAWFAMNNLEGWGGTIESQGTGVFMQGNPDWWYTRQEELCRNMLQRMRELGMQPVIPGFSGQVPNCIVNYTINGFSSGDVVNNGTWAGGYTRPDILKPNTTSYQTFAAVYYKHLHEVMGVSELYSIDPFHEGSLPSGVTNATCYPNIMAELDKHFGNVEQSVKDTYKVTKSPSWIIQYWQGVPQSGAFTAMKNAGYTNRFIGLDLFADNIYADNAAKWRTDYYDTCPYIYCMLHNFGGRSGLHGRLETTMDGYFQALAKGNNCQGIGATPEGTETNPILYDMLFELPWMSSNPGADNWLKEYAYSRYGINPQDAANANALEALKNLKKSVWDCRVNQQGTSEAVILARPNWTIGSVSSWSTSAIYWDTQDVLLAADQLYSVKDIVTANGGQDGIANYNYDFIDVVRQAMVDYAAQLLPLINAARGNDAEYTRLYQLYLQLMLDLDTMLSYDENFKLERWTSLARNIADEVDGTTENDRNWLEWNARTQVTVWSNGNTDLHDYSNRCWAGLIKDFHYKRWEKFFTTKGGSFDGGWFSGFEYPWTVDFNNTYNLAGDYSKVVVPTDMTATEKAAETFGNYFGRVKGATKNYIFPMGVATNATKSDVIPEVYRGQEVELPLIIGKNVTISSVWVDLNNDGNAGNAETLTANGNNVTIPADAVIGKTTAKVTYSDGTVITFNLALIEDITDARTVTAVAGANGSVAIEGTNELSITTTEAVKITATANTGYNFENWTKGGEVVSNDNPFIYYGKEEATFTANFIQDKWGVPTEDKSDWGDAQVKTSFVNELTFAYYNREPETIYEASVAPDNLFNTIPQIINVPQGASFDVTWSDNGDNGLQFCCLSAYIDLNADGDFTDEGELLKVAGTKGAKNTAVCEGKINVILPYDAPLGLTHMRLRFDGAWKDNGYDAATKSFDAKAQLNRMCYEIVINVTEKSDKAATINVETNSADWGTVEVWTDETPDGSTGTEWVVSANIPMYLRATKASEDVEFLGWYDQYGRLVTTELEYSMLAKEDATYTARFRKFLEIDGWQIEYRTQPAQKINLGSEKPVAGKKYYIYANAKNNSSPLYLYNNAGSLATATVVDAANEDAYIWEATASGDYLTFESVATAGQYIGYGNSGSGLTVNTTPVQLDINSTYASGQMSNCVGIMRIGSDSNGKYMVTKKDGSAFNRNSVATNGDWCSDYVFVEIPGDVVILTKVRKSGDHDLVIPETVEILGEQCKIVGFDNNLFKDNKDLWTISLPATIEEMSNNKVFTGVVKGKGANASADASNYITTDLGTTLKPGEDWSISLTIEDNGNNFNQWGSALIATGSAPMNSTYANGFQLYMQSTSNGGKLIVKLDDNNNNNALASISKGTKYRIDIVYTHANTQLVVTATSLAASVSAARAGAARASNSLTLTQDMSDITVVSHAIPEGVNITNLEVRKGPEPDPFEGCTNLLGIEVADGCESYYVDEETRTLKSTGGTTLHTLADEEKKDEIRDLGGLIDLAEALIAEVATSVDPTGKATEIALNATQGNDYYIWCNNPHTSGDDAKGGVAALLDENAGTYLHSNWSSLSSTHDYLQIDFGNAVGLDNFKIAGQQRNGGSNDRPKNIEVYGSNDNTNWTPITTVEGLPDTAGATWESGAISAAERYSHLKFIVKTHDNYNQTSSVSRPYFHMAKFDLLKLTSSAEVKNTYANLAGVTAEDVEGVYDSMAEALYYYNNSGTAKQLQDAYDVLEPLYTALAAKKVFNGVYNINFSGDPVFVAYAEANELNGLTGGDIAGFRLFDGAVTHEGAADGNTSEQKEFHERVIANRAVADALFTIVPNADATGYILSAQGQYMQTTAVHGRWSIQAFDANEANAGVYLFEAAESADIYKLRSNKEDGLQYVNDWGPVFGNNSASDTYARFSLTQVTEYTLNVPANGATTLCLPFNVVLPAGVTAYDLAKENINHYSTYELVTVATAGETIAANTPVIIKATAGDHTLAITMDGEGAKASVENSVLRSGIVKTTLGEGNNYTFDGEDFNRVDAGTVIPANQCWMELDENLGDKVYGTAPDYVLTTDEENPVLYKIQVNRNFNNPTATVLRYNESTGVVNIVASADNNSYQAWYFMEGDNGGILIKPYNGDGKVLGADNNSDGATKVWAVEKDSKTIDEWTFEKNGEWYNILGDGKCFSNHGGQNSGTMGFYNDKNDGGSQFKFVEAEFTNDNARFYQLKDVAETMDAATYYSGTSVGLYSTESVNAYNAIFTTADGLVAAGSNASASADCHAAYKALRAADEVLVYNAPAADKVYYIVSTAADSYCTGKYVRTYSEPHLHQNATWGDKNYDQRHLLFDDKADISQLSLAAFQFEETGTKGEYKMKNLHTGLYVKSFNKDVEHMGTAADAAIVKIAGIADGQVTLKIGSDKPMHAQNDYSVIVTWDASANNASTWSINEVADMSELYTLAVPESGVTTLNLAFNVQLPEGVTAYEVTALKPSAAGYGYEMEQVAAAGDVLAKNTPVVIVASQGVYEFAVTMSDDNVKTAKGTMMNGTNWQSTVSESDTKLYQPVKEDGVIVFKPVADTVAANSAWLETTVVAESIKPHDGSLYGVYKINNNGQPIFVADDNNAIPSCSWYNTTGYKLIDATYDNTDANDLSVQQALVESKVEADALFTIVPNGDVEGYTLTVQGLYLYSTIDYEEEVYWGYYPMVLNTDENSAGVYLFEETGVEGSYKLKSNKNRIQYVGDWGAVFGNKAETETTATFTLTLVTEYTLNVPEGGVTTLCLPFNVVLPEGVEAYDVVEGDFETEDGNYKYNLTSLATAGSVLAKNTPVVIKATKGSYTLNITMDDNGAIPSASGSALRGNYWERDLAADANNYQLVVAENAVVFKRVDAATTAAANTAWMVLSDDKGGLIYDEFPEAPAAPIELTDGGVYRIKGLLQDGTTYRTVYTNGAGNKLRWTSAEKNDATTLFVVQATEDGKFKLVSALANGLWNDVCVLDEDGVELTLLAGKVAGTYAIRGNGYRNFAADGEGTEGEMNYFSSDGSNVHVTNTTTTDFVFEEVTDVEELAKVAYAKLMPKDNNYATLFLPYRATVPDGVTAYTATIENKDQEQQGFISLVEIPYGIIPARTAVVLHRENDANDETFSFVYAQYADAAQIVGNLFGGRVTTGYVGSEPGQDNDKYYLLLNLADKRGEALYKMYREYSQNGDHNGTAGTNNGGYIKCEANKGYMKLSGSAASSYSFRFEGSTGIDEVEGESGEVKAIYDLQGRKLTEITKPGFYIVDGEKVLVK